MTNPPLSNHTISQIPQGNNNLALDTGMRQVLLTLD